LLKVAQQVMRNKSPFQVINANTSFPKENIMGRGILLWPTWRANSSYHFAALSVPSLSGAGRELRNDRIS
jgi:hypothetical protein